MKTRRVARDSAPRRGRALPTALAFAVTALLLVWLALNSLLGPYAGTPRRQALALGSTILAAAGFGVSVAVVLSTLVRRRRLAGYMRPGETIVGLYPGELMDLEGSPATLRARRIRLTLTNQRLLLHEPPSDPTPAVSLEHEAIARSLNRGPITSGGLRRCVLHELVLREGVVLCIRMDASTGLDFEQPARQYLEETSREMRALILEAHGPTPSRPSQPLSPILVGGKPTICVFELNEHYLRVIGEHSPPLADLSYYFHLQHMTVGGLEPAEVNGLPETWKQLRLQFHDASSMVISGSARRLGRLRDRALAAGAATSRPHASEAGG